MAHTTDNHIEKGMRKMVVIDIKPHDFSLQFRDRHSLKVFMRFLKDNDYEFFSREGDGTIHPAEVEVR